MSLLRCLIIDDEPLARKVLCEYVEDIDFLTLAGEAENPVQANNFINKDKIDLLFLDIQMPKMSGIDFLKHLKSAPPVILTTAYSEYALEGYELDVLDYLLKPIGFERFLSAANKAKDYYDVVQQSTAETRPPEFFFVKCDQKLEKINLADVLFVEALANYVIIHTSQRRYVTYLTLKGIEEKLPPNNFVRIHKSYLVSVAAIQSIDRDEVKLIQQKRLPISKHYKAEVMKQINPLLFRR